MGLIKTNITVALAVLAWMAFVPGAGDADTLPPEWVRASGVPVFGFRVVNTFAHDPCAFTQGLVFADGFFFESTGLNGRSTLRRAAVKTGRVAQQFLLAPEYFAEGLTQSGDRLVQLTWKSGLGFVYDRATFKPLHSFRYAGEGWGLTSDAKRLVMSDGTPVLRFVRPEDFLETGRLTVRLGTIPLPHLNELEMVGNDILANIWPTDTIARISPITGQVTALIDLSGLLPAKDRHAQIDVLNGIAYDSRTRRLFVTGKFWPKVFEIEVIEPR
jgi:glutamine cyclotransferase